jgi:hypothetical protein
METLQNLTQTQSQTDVQPQTVIPDLEEVLKINQQKWIDFNAVGGLITEADGSLQPMTISAFATALGVSRQTLYDWKKSIPQFKDRVRQRRLDLGSDARLQKVYNGLYLKASAGVPDAVKLYLQIFDGWKPPSQDHDVKLSTGLADLVAQKKIELDRERKIIDAAPSGNSSPANG